MAGSTHFENVIIFCADEKDLNMVESFGFLYRLACTLSSSGTVEFVVANF